MIFAIIAGILGFISFLFFEQIIFSNFMDYYEGSGLYTLNFVLSGSAGFLGTFIILKFFPKVKKDEDEGKKE